MSRLGALRTMFRNFRETDSWQQLEPCDVLLVRCDGDCGYTFDSKAYGTLIDSLGELLAARGLVVRAVATPYAQLVGERATFSPVSCNRARASSELLGNFARLRGRAARVRWLERRDEEMWTAILQRARPRFIVGINPDSVLCRVARRLGMTTFDLQHGVIAHGVYWYDDRSSEDFDRRDLPNCVLCWDQPSADALRGWTAKGVDVQVIGNAWFSRFLHPRPEDRLVQQEMAAAVWPHTDRPTILVTLQWGLGKLYYPGPEFNGVMVDALEATIQNTAHRYDWLIRLHPVQMRGEEQVAVERYLQGAFGGLDGVEWRHSSRMALPLTLTRADLHLTDFSSVVVEAGWLGMKSGLLNPHWDVGKHIYKYYDFERQVGLAQLLPQDAPTIEAWIERTLAAGKPSGTASHYHDGIDEFVETLYHSCRTPAAALHVA